MKQRHPQARQKMSRVIDEIGAALFSCGATEVSLRLKKEPEGLRLLVQGDYLPVNRPKLERLGKLLQPEIRDPALADTFWELYNPENPAESPYGSSIVNSYCHAWSCTPTYLLRKYFN